MRPGKRPPPRDRLKVRTIAPYRDDRGNVIEYDGPAIAGVNIIFWGDNNRLEVAPGFRPGRLQVKFNASNAVVRLGATPRAVELTIRCGQDSTVAIGDGLTTTSLAHISAVEGTTVTIGRDCMLATGNELRSDDGHPIFEVATGERVNHAHGIAVGDHVWLGKQAVLLGCGEVGSGSVVGFRAVVTSPVPNNCVVAGIPARIVKRDIAWERPHLGSDPPYYKPNATTIEKSPYWDITKG